MSTIFPESGPKAYGQTYGDLKLDGVLGAVHCTVDKAANKLVNDSEASFPLTGEGFETRKGKFLNTLKTFTTGAGAVGAVVGTATMAPIDLLVGRGSAPAAGERGKFIDEGALGTGAQYVGSVVSGGIEVVGKGVGGAAAAISMPAKGDDKSAKKWIRGGVDTGGKLAGKGAGHLLGTGLGLAIDVARLPSIIVKGVLKGTFSVVGGTIGFFAASVRAIINK
jgi:hypothetical protein